MWTYGIESRRNGAILAKGTTKTKDEAITRVLEGMRAHQDARIGVAYDLLGPETFFIHQDEVCAPGVGALPRNR